MVRKALPLLPITAAILSSCGKPQLALSQDPIERAATCGVVAAAEARAASNDVRSPLSLEAQGNIIRPALLVAARGDSFSVPTAAAVVNRMPEIQEKITSGKFETLLAPCRQAFPETRASAVTLPGDMLTARIGCYEMGGFLNRALGDSGDAYTEELTRYGAMRRELDPRIASGLAARGISGRGEQAKVVRSAAMAEMVKLGSPTQVMDACVDRFGASKSST